MTSNGSGAAVEGMGCHIHNQADPASRLYWQQMCLNMTASGVIDGCGADASWMTGTEQAGQWGVSPQAGAAWGAGHQQMLRKLSWPLLGDGVTLGKQASEVGDYVSGVLAEECTPSNNTINLLREVSARATQQRRRLIYECHWKPKDSPNGKFKILSGGVHVLPQKYVCVCVCERERERESARARTCMHVATREGAAPRRKAR